MDDKPIIIIFHRIGPYHLARIRAASKVCLRPIIAVESSDNDDIYAWDTVDAIGIEKVTIFSGVKASEVSRAGLIERFKDIFNKYCPSMVCIQGWTHLGIAALLEANRIGVPVCLMSESSRHDFKRNPVKEWLKRRVVNYCSVAVVGGRLHRRYLVDLGMPYNNVSLGYDAVDNAHFYGDGRLESHERNFDHGDRPFFLASGRFIEKKNFVELCVAYSEYVQLVGEDAWDLVLIGDGQMRGDIEKAIKSYNLESRIHLPGFVQYSDLPSYYKQASCFVHIALTEQWGLVVNEALASGLPAIVSDRCGSTRELILDDFNGWIVNPTERHEIVDAMILASNKSNTALESMGLNSRGIIKNWDVDRFGSGVFQAIEKSGHNAIGKMNTYDKLALHLALRLI